MILCLEGPSAAGKTTLARVLADRHRAAVIPELDASTAPPPAEAEPWFSERHAERWEEAIRLAATAPLVVLDCDPLKGLWYNWIHAEKGWPGVDVVEREYARLIRAGRLGIPFYVYLDATVAQLRQRRADDPTRQRRGFEKNVTAIEPQRRYFVALNELDPGRVAFIDTSDRGAVVQTVLVAVGKRPATASDPLALLRDMSRWIRENAPFATTQGPDSGMASEKQEGGRA